LRKAGIHVDPMEDWTADSAASTRFCLERIDGCQLCILLVALRLGYIPDGSNLSITQMEYQYALAHGVDVLVFLLREDEPWPRRFDELDKDPGIRSWRAELGKRHGVEFFGLQPDSVNLLPAVLRWREKAPAQPAPPALVNPFDFSA